MSVRALLGPGVLCLALGLLVVAGGAQVGAASIDGPAESATTDGPLESASTAATVGTALEGQASLGASPPASRASVASADGNGTPNVVLLAIDAPTTRPTVAGETITVTVIGANVDSFAGERTVEFRVDGETRDERTVDLEPDETSSFTFSYETREDDVGDLDVAVAANNTIERTLDVEAPTEPAVLSTNITNVSTDLVAGESLAVEAVVENSLGTAEEKPVELVVDGEVVDETTVDLFGPQRRTLDFEHATDESDVGDLNVSVRTPDDADSRTVTVGSVPGPFFDVELVDVPDSVQVGESATVEAVVENTGTGAGEQPVSFAFGDRVVGDSEYALEPGERRTLSFEYATLEDDRGTHEVSVESADDDARKTVEVREPPEPADFDVEIDDAPMEVEAGETVSVEASVENVGERAGEQSVAFDVDGATREESTVALDGGERETRTFTYETDESDVGDLPLEVSSENDTATRTVEVREPPEPAFFDVSIDDAPTEVEAGETVSVEASVENTGDRAGEQPVEFRVDGALESATDVTLDGGASESVSFAHETDADDAGNLSLEVASEDDAATRTVAVAEPGPVGVQPYTDAFVHATEDVEVSRGTVDLTGDVRTGGAYRQSREATVTGSYEVHEGAAVDREPHDAYVDDLVASGDGEFTSLWDDRYDPEGGCDSRWTCEERVFDEAGVHYLEDVALQSGQPADVVVDLADVEDGETVDVVVDGDLTLESADLRVENWETGAVRFWVAGDVTVHRMDRPTVGPVGSDGTNADVLQLYGTSSTDVTFAEASVQFEGVLSAPGDTTVSLRNGEHVVHGAIDAGSVHVGDQRVVGVYDETLPEAEVGGGPL